MQKGFIDTILMTVRETTNTSSKTTAEPKQHVPRDELHRQDHEDRQEPECTSREPTVE